MPRITNAAGDDRHTPTSCPECDRDTRLAYAFQPGGLRTGSPSSPPPHLIRLTVRLLLWSPRLLGPGPRGQLLSESGGRRLLLRDLNEFRQNVLVMLRQVAGDPLVRNQAAQISLSEHKIEVVGAV